MSAQLRPGALPAGPEAPSASPQYGSAIRSGRPTHPQGPSEMGKRSMLGHGVGNARRTRITPPRARSVPPLPDWVRGLGFGAARQVRLGLRRGRKSVARCMRTSELNTADNVLHLRAGRMRAPHRHTARRTLARRAIQSQLGVAAIRPTPRAPASLDRFRRSWHASRVPGRPPITSGRPGTEA